MYSRTHVKRRVLLVTALAAVLLPSCAFALTFTRPLSLGSVGADVFSLQQLLDQGRYLSAQPTGYFGPLTEAAVKQYQTAHGLEVVGSVGPLTRALLNGTATPAASTATASCTSLTLTRPLGLGSTGADVTELQQFLNGKNYLSFQPTGYFGPLTQAAVNNLQNDYGLEQVGSVGPLTRTLIEHLSISCSTQTVTTTATSSYTPGVTPLPGYTPGQVILIGGSSNNNNGGGGGGSSSAPDTIAPTAPTNLAAVADSLSELDLSWGASSDNVNVAGYKIFRDGTQVGTTSLTSYADTGLTASSTHTYTVRAYDAANNVSSASNVATSTTGTWSDGFAGAPLGSIEHPTLLQNYITRPAWRVAGVDYYVGVSSGFSLKDPLTATLPSGVTRDTANHLFEVTGNNVTLNGWDFSLEGGWGVIVGADGNAGEGQNITVENCNFAIGSNLNDPLAFRSGASGATIMYNTINGNGVEANISNEALLYPAGGTVTIEYNIIENAYAASIHTSNALTPTNIVMKYNVIENAALGLPSIHGDWFFPTGPMTYSGIVIDFNTVIQNSLGTLGSDGTDGITVGGPFAGLIVNGAPDVSNNTIVALNDPNHTGSTDHNHTTTGSVFVFETDQIANNPTVSENYADISGVGAGGWYQTDSNQGGSSAAAPALSDNINLLTGGLLPDQAPIISSVFATTSQTTATTTWTTNEAASSKAVYGPTTAYGSATSSASLATSHSLSISGLSAGTTYHYEVVSTDTFGNTSTSTDQTFTTASPSYTGPGDVVAGAVAWWGLRAYSAAKAGTKAINICRASDSTCEDIDTLANGNLDTTTAVTFCTSTTCNIKAWYDQSGANACNGSACDMSQSATSSRAALTFNCLGSLPCGTSSNVSTAGYATANNISESQPFTYSAVFDRTASVTYYLIGQAGGNQFLGGASFSPNLCEMYAGGAITDSSCSDNAWHAVQAVFNSTGSFMYRDGTATSGDAGSSGLSQFLSFEWMGQGTTTSLTGTAAEGGVWASAFSTSTASSLNSNQHTYWGF